MAGADDAGLAAKLERGLDDPDPLVRGCAVHGLLHLDPNDVGAMLLGTMGRGSAERALLTSIVARSATEPGLRERLVERACEIARGTPDAGIRGHAAAACAIGSAPAAADFARDPSWIVRARLVEALRSGDGRLEAAEREALIERLGEDPHPTVRRLARAARGGDGQVPPGGWTPDRMEQ